MPAPIELKAIPKKKPAARVGLAAGYRLTIREENRCSESALEIHKEMMNGAGEGGFDRGAGGMLAAWGHTEQRPPAAAT